MNNYTRLYTWQKLKNQKYAAQNLKKKQNFKKFVKPSLYIVSTVVILLIGIVTINYIYNAIFSNYSKISASEKKTLTLEKEKIIKPVIFSTFEIKTILEKQNLINSDKKEFAISLKDKTYTIVTSFNIPLQKFLLKKINGLKKLTRAKPQQIAVVAMEPASGKILALAGFDLLKNDSNPCLDSTFPAASIFKIITAAAAIEELEFTPYTPLYFNGSKYTLYKRQLKDVKNKYTSKISFGSAFAESVNPVFGKIGKNRLGSVILEKYAEKFGFNKNIDSELEFNPGNFEINGTPYQWAEIACGFNHTTTISPLFGAMITSSIINGGKKVIPSVVEKIVDSQNDIIYDNKDRVSSRAVSKNTASIVQTLMQKTIENGTARKTFRRRSKDKILSKLVIGGKTGSIYNKEHTVKYDWFTGFAKDKKNNMIAISILVGHGDYIGTRACSHAKVIIKEYYKNI